MDLIGKEVWYRNGRAIEMKKAVVVSSQTFCSLRKDHRFTILTMDNGDKVASYDIYSLEANEEEEAMASAID
jgi:hypothetical protein